MVALLLWLAASETARADAPRFEVTAPAACGDLSTFEALLADFLSREAIGAATHVSASVVIEGDAASGFALFLDIDEHGALVSSRTVRHPSNCTLLLRIAALIVSMALDPDAVELPVELLASEGLTVGTREVPEHVAAPAPVALVAEPPAAVEQPEVPVAASGPSAVPVTVAPLRGRAHVLVGVDARGAGSVAPSFALGAGLVRRQFLADATLVVAGPGRTNVQQDPNYRARVLALTLELAACGRIERGRFSFAGCPRLDVGFVQSRLTTPTVQRSDAEPRVRASAEARVGVTLVPGRLDLEARAFIGADLLTPSFGYGPRVGEPLVPRFDGGASLGATYRFE